MKRVVVGVAAAFIVTAGQAAAEGLPPQSRIRGPEPVAPRWTGFYIGAGIGAGAASYDITGTKNRTVRETTQSCSPVAVTICGHTHYVEHCTDSSKDVTYTTPFSDSGTTDVGVFGVVTVGYDRVLKQGWVAGVFADADFGSGISGNVSVGGVQSSLDHNHSWAVGARLGYLVTPSTLLYGTAGYTQAEFELSGFGAHDFRGYFVGAGVETFLRPNWSLRLEYRYSDFGAETVVDTANMSAELDPSMHSARLVLTYRP
jgi:outer membrane immunogenic protein